MNKIKRSLQSNKFVHRDSAEKYLMLTLLSFAASVTLTRLFLSLANYPQIGGGELHIAHVLWGGLLLYAAALLPLIFANRRVYTFGALLAGVGVGLFIDEVGKFITASNDYFFPVAASIIYIFFLFTMLLFLRIRRQEHALARDEITRIFEDVWEVLQHPLPEKELHLLRSRLETAANSSSTSKHAELAKTLLRFLDEDAPAVFLEAAEPETSSPRATRILTRFSSEKPLRIYLIVGLIAIGLLNLKNPLSLLLASPLPEISRLLAITLGRAVPAMTSPFWSAVRVVLEIIVGTLMLTSAGLLIAKKTSLGITTGIIALLLSITTLNVLLFYFEQFSTILTTTIQFLLFIGLSFYRRRMDRKT
jgi:hypothetical protein